MKLVSQRYVKLAVADLLSHPFNAKIHDERVIAESIDVNGFYGAVLVQRSTNRILAGHGRVRAAAAAGAMRVPAIVLDVDDRTALRILSVDNRSTELGGEDDRALAALLREVKTEAESLAGTGYTDDDLEAILARLGDEAAEGPDPSAGRDGESEEGHGIGPADGPALIPPRFAIIIECADERDQTDELARLISQGRKARALMS